MTALNRVQQGTSEEIALGNANEQIRVLIDQILNPEMADKNSDT